MYVMCFYFLLLTEHYDDAWAYFQSAVFDTIQKQNHVAHDFQPNLMIDVSEPCFLDLFKKNNAVNVYLIRRENSNHTHHHMVHVAYAVHYYIGLY